MCISRAHRRAGQSQHRVDANRAQKGAFAGHVGAADHQHLALPVQLHVIAHTVVLQDQRMAQAISVQQRCL